MSMRWLLCSLILAGCKPKPTQTPIASNADYGDAAGDESYEDSFSPECVGAADPAACEAGEASPEAAASEDWDEDDASAQETIPDSSAPAPAQVCRRMAEVVLGEEVDRVPAEEMEQCVAELGLLAAESPEQWHTYASCMVAGRTEPELDACAEATDLEAELSELEKVEVMTCEHVVLVLIEETESEQGPIELSDDQLGELFDGCYTMLDEGHEGLSEQEYRDFLDCLSSRDSTDGMIPCSDDG